MTRPFDRLAFIMEYESHQMHPDDIAEGFQHLINDGTVWQLQGHYGRMAVSLIGAGYCNPAERAAG